MECSNTKCLKPESDRMVSCWLCLKYYHLKCSSSNLRARDADALADSQKFLNWTCVSCRNIGLEFYNLFKNSKDEFEKINQEFLSVQMKLANFGELFSKYNNLDKFMNSLLNLPPKHAKKNTENVATQCSLPPPSCSNNVSESDVITSLSNSISSPSLFTSADRTTIPLIKHSDCPSQTPISSPALSINNDLLNISNATSLLPANNTLRENQTCYAQTSASSIDLNTNQKFPKPLRAIRPNKSIFVSRLAADTTIDDVEYYIKTKCDASLITSVYKFAYSEPRIVSSFKITVADEIFNHVIAPDFWPTGTIVREFVFKERLRKSVRLPASVSNISKN